MRQVRINSVSPENSLRTILAPMPRMTGVLSIVLAGCFLAGGLSISLNCAAAQEGGKPAAALEAAEAPAANPPPSISTSVPALGDFKQALLDRGFNLRLNYTGDTFGNVSGGIKQGAIYEGLLDMGLDGDLEKIAGLKGASFHINAFLIHGRGLSTYYIDNFSTISDIEARRTTRLFEAWFEQKLFGDLASIRIGQLAADQEFFISDFGSLYINGTFGWPNITAADQPSGGPAYPLATPAVRIKVTPNDQLTLLAAVFNGDPSGAGFSGLQEILDPAGINFRLRDPPLVIGEAQYKYNQEKKAAGLAGTARLGVWYHFGPFSSYRTGTDGYSLAAPLSNGIPITFSGNYGIYGVIDQMIWREPGDDPKKGVGAFARFSGSPSDRNLMDLYAEAGVNFIGVWDKRPDDQFGVAAAFSRISSDVSAFDQDTAFFTGTTRPIRNYELALEVTYQAQIIPGFVIQPDFQYIFHPGGGAVDPLNPNIGRIPDAAIFGLQSVIRF
jgi:porin